MTLLIKICGLSTPEALDVALDAGADLVGFVFEKGALRDEVVEAVETGTLGALALQLAVAERERDTAQSRIQGAHREHAELVLF